MVLPNKLKIIYDSTLNLHNIEVLIKTAHKEGVKMKAKTESMSI